MAQEAQKSATFVSNFAQAESATDAAISQIFDSRWSTSGSDYVLSEDGVVAPEKTAKKDQLAGIHIGTRQRAYAMEDDTPENTIVGKIPTGQITQNGVANAAQDNTSSVQVCGPSPLSPSEIKKLVVDAARRHKVDEVFATAIAWAESGFDQTRNSDKGARGPMQLMPATAEQFQVADICDPEQNIEGGMKYLRVLLDEFQNPLLVAAAYNSGEQRIYEYGGIPPFRETVGYVAKVVNYQLGLPMPKAKAKPKTSGTTTIADGGENGDVGVIAVKKTGKFVGGVMHF
ncbi:MULTISPECIES: lytic transglycosylase domain-containing protein [unclassified Mesorhizobium]|uniref:lytic transglycosylase domain-containing protein n=2 Tax=Mesorhizobium TaxID=68287 RepID=UPI000FCBDF7C|nr:MULTISPECIES: lytic transglycosylase domain-containing protein [unclassified Mesorhizobium]RUV97054.1 lytic transglycosylase domain-containing protein [Mesorhizobium sp. M1A.F.Ca.IN.020.04.1.1]RUW06362.1 lytic transglycosylase domain-containing protein [Mesorhizobium sp. M1A.F.Ca.IN.020.03.1.1]